MSLPAHLRSVSRREPCPICGKPDWCIRVVGEPRFARDGELYDTLCNRIPNNREPITEALGYPYIAGDQPGGVIGYVTKAVNEPPPPDWPAMHERFFLDAHYSIVQEHSESMGFEPNTLAMLRLGYSVHHKAMVFPMFDAEERVTGFRIRHGDGRKLSVPSSKNGIFLPAVSAANRTGPTVVCEGPTDTAAALQLGLCAIGRADALTTGNIARKWLDRRQGNPVIIVLDNEKQDMNPDQRDRIRRASESLATSLVLGGFQVWMMTPPASHKDLRAWVTAGCDREAFLFKARNQRRYEMVSA